MSECVVNIFDVAKYILDAIGGEMSTIKLQKLCYYSQAWHLAFCGTPIFKENFIHWDYGPACLELWEMHSGRIKICANEIPEELCTRKKLGASVCGAINYSIDKYGHLNEFELCRKTHNEDPWALTSRNEVITQNSMMNYYFEKYGEGRVLPDKPYSAEEFSKIINNSTTEEKFCNAEEMFKKIGVVRILANA